MIFIIWPVIDQLVTMQIFLLQILTRRFQTFWSWSLKPNPQGMGHGMHILITKFCGSPIQSSWMVYCCQCALLCVCVYTSKVLHDLTSLQYILHAWSCLTYYLCNFLFFPETLAIFLKTFCFCRYDVGTFLAHRVLSSGEPVRNIVCSFNFAWRTCILSWFPSYLNIHTQWCVGTLLNFLYTTVWYGNIPSSFTHHFRGRDHCVIFWKHTSFYSIWQAPMIFSVFEWSFVKNLVRWKLWIFLTLEDTSHNLFPMQVMLDLTYGEFTNSTNICTTNGESAFEIEKSLWVHIITQKYALQVC